MKKYLTYDDVQIIPKYSNIEHRKDCNTITRVTKNIWLDLPIVSSPMDTVTDFFMCMEMDRLGGMGILHRFQKSFEVGNTIDQFRHQRPDGTIGGGALGRMRVDKLVGKDANSAVNVEKGLVVTGVVTATQFKGDGSQLSGLASREVYGFTGIGNSLSLTTTNNGADNIDNATYVAFEESFIGPSGISFSINTSGNLIMTV